MSIAIIIALVGFFLGVTLSSFEVFISKAQPSKLKAVFILVYIIMIFYDIGLIVYLISKLFGA